MNLEQEELESGMSDEMAFEHIVKVHHYKPECRDITNCKHRKDRVIMSALDKLEIAYRHIKYGTHEKEFVLEMIWRTVESIEQGRGIKLARSKK